MKNHTEKPTDLLMRIHCLLGSDYYYLGCFVKPDQYQKYVSFQQCFSNNSLVCAVFLGLGTERHAAFSQYTLQQTNRIPYIVKTNVPYIAQFPVLHQCFSIVQ